jgi:hypothetical protein
MVTVARVIPAPMEYCASNNRDCMGWDTKSVDSSLLFVPLRQVPLWQHVCLKK